MEAFVTCLVFLAAAALLGPFVLSIAHARKIKGIESALRKLSERTALLETQSRGATPSQPLPPAEAAPIATVPIPPTTPSVPAAVPPPLPPPLPISPAGTPTVKTASGASAPVRPAPVSTPRAPIDWEAFMGVKLFAWIGGFALFLGVVFLVKYSFENNLITPFMRVLMGAVIGCGLIAAGWFTARRNYRVPGQSLCATGVLVLYADIFGAHAFYDLISLTTAFALMSVVTIVAFLLAVRLDAQVVVVLGLVGGFLTPPLLTESPDDALRLFGYVALLNAGIAAVAIRKRWDYLLLLGAIGTVLTEIAWLPAYDNAGRASAGFLIFLAMEAQFLAFAYLRQKQQPPAKWPGAAATLVGFAALSFAFWLLPLSELAERPGFFFGFTFLADLGLLALALLWLNPARIAAPAGTVVFALLAAWTAIYLQHHLLWWALGAYLLFAVIHAGFSVWPPRAETKAPAAAATWQSYVPLLALGLLFLCVWHGETSFAVWACVLLVNIIAVGLAWNSASLAALVVALIVTLVTAGWWIMTAPPINESIVGILIVVGGFGVFFTTASTFLTRKLGFGAGESRRNVPALAAALPFVLLMMLIGKLPVTDPTAVFAVALLLAIVLLGLGIVARTSWIAAVALAFTWAVEREWHTLHFSTDFALLALGWYLGFFLLFVAYPFFTGGTRAVASESDGTAAVPPADTPLPWAIGAISGVLHYWLIDELVSTAYPNLRSGLLPALFILPYAFGAFYLINHRGIAPASGDARLAWQGGAALFFLSLIFPVQFQREWVTLGWAVEGLALLVLFRFVPNGGLRLVGAGLLSVAFVRLALNPAVFEYHRRTPTRIWNWYFYTYGITCLCLFAGARLVRQFQQTLLERVVPRLLYTLGAVLAFLLLNIEIADYFSVGPTLTFSFSGNFARDMTYSIAWALFAFVLLLIGMKKHLRYVRYAGLALLVITLLKLFLHDLGNLSQLYRIGAFIGVALILIVASFVYQRFLAPPAKAPD